MELAIGIDWEDGRARALLLDKEKKQTHHPCDYMVRHGLPLLNRTRIQCTTDFARWTPASFVEFACAIGLDASVPERHLTWQFMHADIRYVVPALVLIRAMFKPPSYVLPRLFRPQSLDDVCNFSGEGPMGFITPVTALGSVIHRMRRAVMLPLSWFYCFPSARETWSSVFHLSCEGQIGLTLPQGELSLVIKGLSHAKNVYVTEAHIRQVNTAEEPFDFASTHTRTIYYLSGESIGSKGKRIPLRLIALRDGASSVSDEEWQEIRPMIDAGFRGKSGVPMQRATLDGVLSKFCFATTWQQTVYPPGVTMSGAVAAVHRWKRDGRWERIIEVLRRSRGELDDDDQDDE